MGRYEVQAGRVVALTWVFDGTFRNAPPYDQPGKYGSVAGWWHR